MCIAPNKLADGTLVACRKCWQCWERKIDDVVGRCIAESQDAKRTFSITLTYGRDEMDKADHIRAALLTYSDVQKYMKRLRESGYVVRYFAVGEYGSMKGRAHWHLITFYYSNQHVIEARKALNAEIAAGRKKGKLRPIPDGMVPEHEISTRGPDGKLEDVRFSEAHWQHGWSCWEELLDDYEMSAARAVRYVCKYMQKGLDVDEWWQGHTGRSKKPPLGDGFVRRRAAQWAREGLAPQDLFYSFPGVVDAEGKTKRFRLSGVSADNYIDYYLEALHGEAKPEKPTPGKRKSVPKAEIIAYERALWEWIKKGLNCKVRPNSELVEQYLDRLAAPGYEAEKYRIIVKDKERALIRKRRFDPVYGPGFNLWPRKEGGQDV